MSQARGPVRRRLLPLVCAGLAVAAAALAGAARLAWYAADVPAAGRAPVRVEITGADALPGLNGVALLALAAVAAAVALSGLVRRLLGVLLALVAAWLAVALATTPAPSPAQLAALPAAPAGAAVPAAVESAAGGPVVAGIGSLALAVTGAALALAEPRLRRFGARYAGARARRAEPDPQRAAWDALDAGRDPTID